MKSQDVTRAYARLSSHYDRIFERAFDGGRQKLFTLLPDKDPLDVLEVGIGTGLSIPFYPLHAQVTGIDFSPGMLTQARDRIRETRARAVDLRVMDASRMAFDDGTFDAVVAAYVISATSDPDGMLREIMRVCKPGGTILFLNHFRSEHPVIGGIERTISRWCHRWGFRTDLELRPLLDRVGLKPASVHKVNFLGLWRLVRCINPGPSGSVGRAREQA